MQHTAMRGTCNESKVSKADVHGIAALLAWSRSQKVETTGVLEHFKLNFGEDEDAGSWSSPKDLVVQNLAPRTRQAKSGLQTTLPRIQAFESVRRDPWEVFVQEAFKQLKEEFFGSVDS